MPDEKTLGNWKRNVTGLAVSVACLAFIAWRIDLAEVRHALAQFRWPYLVWGMLPFALGYTLRILRWSMLLRAAGARVSFRGCVAPFLGSIALNNVLPMRLGDVVRALVFPASIGVDRVTATGSLLMERLVDLITLLAALALGLAFGSLAALPDWMAYTAVALAVVSGLCLALISFFSGRLAGALGTRPGRTIAVMRDLLHGFEGMARGRMLLPLFSLSMVAWAAEAGLFWLVLRGFGFDVPAATGLVVMAIATLSTLIPSAPGYVGPFHLAAFAAISALGGTPAQAASFAVVSHLSVWLPTTLAGAVSILLHPALFARAKANTALNR